jgi:hypothetical protein
MTFAYDYPLLGVLWTTLWFFLFIAWIMALFRIFADIFRSRDMGGFAKALWTIFVIFLPILGVCVYLIARGEKMFQRDIEDARAQDAAFRSYVQEAAGSGGGVATELSNLAALRDAGTITQAEYDAAKAKILA